MFMQKIYENNYAFIDSQNVNLSIRSLGWILDFEKLRIFLKEKYGVQKAFLFLGFLKENQKMYSKLKSYGYELIFKPVIQNHPNGLKGNVDAELVLHSMIEYSNYNKAIIISGDGDFYCLAEYLIKNDKLKKVLIPNETSYSSLLKSINTADIKSLSFLNHSKKKLEYLDKRKGPQQDQT
jgi:uncharacterized LabA/DUF88 family protein